MGTEATELGVTLFRDFVEDRRISMEVYADGLLCGLKTDVRYKYSAHEFRPTLPRRLGSSIWAMRLARYCAYPWQARRQQGTVNHILDHAYGHLLYVLDPARTIVSVHDLIPLMRWKGRIGGVSRGLPPWLNLLSLGSLNRAAHLIAASEHTRQDLVNFCGCRPERISVVHYGIDSTFRRFGGEERKRAREKWGAPDDGTWRVLTSGAQFYKNQQGALEAFALLRNAYKGSLELMKMGAEDDEWQDYARRLGLGESARSLGPVHHADVPELLNIVDCLLFPSLYEGHGLPPLEAMACGTPVVTSNAASLPEVVGDAGIMCDPEDTSAMSEAMLRLIEDQAFRQGMIQRGLSRAREFSWHKTLQDTTRVYDLVAADHA